MAVSTKERKPNAKVDWIAAKQFYLSHNEVGLREIAKKFDVSFRVVSEHSAKEGWATTRQNIVERTTLKMEDNIVDELSERNIQHANYYKAAQTYFAARINNSIRKFKVLQERDPTAPINEKLLISGQQAGFLISGLKEAINGERVALGLPTNVTKSENDLNILNPYANYQEDQLEQILKASDAELRAKYAIEGEVAGSNRTSQDTQ